MSTFSRKYHAVLFICNDMSFTLSGFELLSDNKRSGNAFLCSPHFCDDMAIQILCGDSPTKCMFKFVASDCRVKGVNLLLIGCE